MHPMRQAERGRDSTLLVEGCPAWTGGSCPMKCEDFSHRREEAPGTPLLRPSNGGYLTGKLPLTRLTITRQPGERFGLRISGGVPVSGQDGIAASNGPLGRCLSSLSNDGSILVTWVSSDGAVGRDGRLKPGDRLLEVNGHWMMGSTLDEALTGTSDRIDDAALGSAPGRVLIHPDGIKRGR
ncbi:unnamed protein product [Echinostoma caproni]|uniref:PDZ domain-containing protein n=1 Tax=Echinostoma caproni TaxID=27848 RepID=A0A183AJK4_9TREM|nr:unnamed protein product [Echinostoma caproni]